MSSPSLSWAQRPVVELVGHKKVIHAISWNLTGDKLASGSVDNTVRIWQPETHQHGKEMKLEGHAAGIEFMKWHPLGEDRLATASIDKTCRIWDTNSGKCVRKIECPGENLNMDYHPSGKQIVIGDRHDNLSVIDVGMGKIMKTQKLPVELNEITFSKNGKFVYLALADGIEIYSWPQMTKVDKLLAHPQTVYSVKETPDNKHLVTGGSDGLACLWSLEHRVCLSTFDGMSHPIRAVGITYDSEYIVVGSEDPFIHFCKVPTMESVFKIPTSAETNAIACNPKKALMATAGGVEQRDKIPIKIFGLKPKTR